MTLVALLRHRVAAVEAARRQSERSLDALRLALASLDRTLQAAQDRRDPTACSAVRVEIDLHHE